MGDGCAVPRAANEQEQRHLEELRLRLATEHPDLTPRQDDAFLLAFLRAKKYRYDDTIRTVCNYYRNQVGHSLFDDLRPSRFTHLFDLDTHILSRDYDDAGRRVLILRKGKWIPSNCCTLKDMFPLDVFTLDETVFRDDKVQRNGIVFVLDFSGYSFRDIPYMSIGFAQQNLRSFLSGFPAKSKAVHVINQHLLWSLVWTLMRPLLSDKLRQRVILHGSEWRQTLYEHVPKRILPEEYGGDAGSVRDMDWFWDQLLSDDERFVAPFRDFGYLNFKSQ